MAFEIAAKAAFKEGMQKAGAQLLEPMMKVEVVTPEEYMGDIIGDLNSRRGQVSSMDDRGNAKVIMRLCRWRICLVTLKIIASQCVSGPCAIHNAV